MSRINYDATLAVKTSKYNTGKKIYLVCQDVNNKKGFFKRRDYGLVQEINGREFHNERMSESKARSIFAAYE